MFSGIARRLKAPLLVAALALAACSPVPEQAPHAPARPAPLAAAPGAPAPLAAAPAAPGEQRLEVGLTDPATGQAVAPDGVLALGYAYDLRVALLEGGHAVARLQDGTLDPARVQVQGQGFTFHPQTRQVLTDAAPPRDPAWRYSLAVSLRGGPAAPALAFAPDTAPLFGPEPDDVTELAFTVGGSGEGGALLPGETGALELKVTDRLGRAFSSGQSPLRVALAERVRVRGDGIRFDPQQWTVTLPRAAVRLGQTSYAITVEYGPPGRAAGPTQVTRRFPVDYTLVHGPEPHDVKSVEVKLAGLNSNDTLDPGKVVPFAVVAIDTRGRRFITGKSDSLPLPWSRLTIQAQNLDVNREAATITAEPDLVKIAGKNYHLTVSYGGVKSLTATYVLRPELYAWYRDRTLTGPDLQLIGPSGALGQDGVPGDAGHAGRAGDPARARRADGTPGDPGSAGAAGGPGQRGPDVVVSATLVRTFDNLVDLIFVEVNQGGKRSYSFRRPKDGPLRIVSKGGTGGGGGTGGAGGDGAPGAPGGNGGDGGAGGNGGPGGIGGDGGTIQLFLSRSDLQRYFVLESTPGGGGTGGHAGTGGRGGRAGEPLSGARPQAGRQGQQGLEGQAGAPGRPGQTSIVTGGPAADLNNNPPADYRRNLFFVNVRVGAEQKVLSGGAAAARPDVRAPQR